VKKCGRRGRKDKSRSEKVLIRLKHWVNFKVYVVLRSSCFNRGRGRERRGGDRGSCVLNFGCRSNLEFTIDFNCIVYYELVCVSLKKCAIYLNSDYSGLDKWITTYFATWIFSVEISEFALLDILVSSFLQTVSFLKKKKIIYMNNLHELDGDWTISVSVYKP